ncbi:MAG: hypothetical protein WBH77_10210, partial [Saccharofermentanales bacterium]
MNKRLSFLAIISLVLALLLTGCGGKGKNDTEMAKKDSERGVIVLSVNPEIEIEYDKDGKVTDVRGVNKD